MTSPGSACVDRRDLDAHRGLMATPLRHLHPDVTVGLLDQARAVETLDRIGAAPKIRHPEVFGRGRHHRLTGRGRACSTGNAAGRCRPGRGTELQRTGRSRSCDRQGGAECPGGPGAQRCDQLRAETAIMAVGSRRPTAVLPGRGLGQQRFEARAVPPTGFGSPRPYGQGVQPLTRIGAADRIDHVTHGVLLAALMATMSSSPL